MERKAASTAGELDNWIVFVSNDGTFHIHTPPSTALKPYLFKNYAIKKIESGGGHADEMKKNRQKNHLWGGEFYVFKKIFIIIQI